ncbi:ribonuclease E inhibitor RraB [Nocardioides mangrovicus]|nr:ribonuclease E inhibitor RraB [Nocardioides mangrovicus]
MRLMKQRSQTRDVHPADAIQLEAMANRGEQDTRVRWVHHLYFADEATARQATEQIEAAGWAEEWLSAQPEPYPGWMMRASRDVVVTAAEVVEARAFFEGVAQRHGGTYGGWDVRRVPKHALV